MGAAGSVQLIRRKRRCAPAEVGVSAEAELEHKLSPTDEAILAEIEADEELSEADHSVNSSIFRQCLQGSAHNRNLELMQESAKYTLDSMKAEIVKLKAEEEGYTQMANRLEKEEEEAKASFNAEVKKLFAMKSRHEAEITRLRWRLAELEDRKEHQGLESDIILGSELLKKKRLSSEASLPCKFILEDHSTLEMSPR
eukprot:Colp12_sorted_trinity150504_noHs@32123